MTCQLPFFTRASYNSDTTPTSRPAGDSFEASAIGCPQKDLIDMERPAQDRQQKAWLRRRLHAARSCARMPHLAEP